MNNLFSFATKELSQDAFLCWAINWMSEATKGTPFYDMGKSVMSLFLGKHAFDEYEKVCVLRQYKHIDVLVLFEHSNQRYGLIIEDKTNTSEHSNQIQKYFDTVITDTELNVNAENLHVAYVKTGILYDEDKRVKANIVTLEQLLNALHPYVESTQSQILSDYVEYLNIEFIKRTSIAKLINDMEVTLPLKTEDDDNGKPLLATYYGQYFFLDTIFKTRDIEKRLDIRKSVSDKPYYEYLGHSIVFGVKNTPQCSQIQKIGKAISCSGELTNLLLAEKMQIRTPNTTSHCGIMTLMLILINLPKQTSEKKMSIINCGLYVM